MVEPRDFSEIFIDAECVETSWQQINTVCQHTFNCYKYHIDKVKKLNKFLEQLTSNKNSILQDLETIQDIFDNMESKTILFLHNLEKVKIQLNILVDLKEEEFNSINISSTNNDLSDNNDKTDIKDD